MRGVCMRLSPVRGTYTRAFGSGRVLEGLFDLLRQRHQGLRERHGGPGEHRPRHRGRRVRVSRRGQRFRQEHHRADAPQGDRALRGHDPRKRRKALGDTAPLRAQAPQEHRVRLPGLQAPAQQDGRRERCLRDGGDGAASALDPHEGAPDPGTRGAPGQVEQVPRPALRRRAAAGLHRAGVRGAAADPHRGRAHGEPGPGHERRDHAAPA